MTEYSRKLPVQTAGVVARKAAGVSIRRHFLPKMWYAHLTLWIACAFVCFPLLYAMLISTQSNPQVANFQLVPGDRLSANWHQVMVVSSLGEYMARSVILAVVITAGSTVLAMLAGLAFVYFRFPGKWIVFAFVLVALLVPGEILIIGLYRFVAGTLKWGGKFQAVVVPFLASAGGTFLFRQYFANLPAELSEAAQLDGANPIQFLIRVLIPLSWNAVGALAVIQYIGAWNMYLWPRLIMTGGDFQVVQIGMSSLTSTDTMLVYGPLMLASVVATIPPLIVFMLLQKQLMLGFQISAEK